MKTIKQVSIELGKSTVTIRNYIEKLGIEPEIKVQELTEVPISVLSEDQFKLLKNYKPKNGRPKQS